MNRQDMKLPQLRLVAIARFAEILQQLQADAYGVLSATLASVDGLTIASTLAEPRDADKLSAMAGSISALAGALTHEVGHIDAERLILETATGRVLTMNVPLPTGAIVLAVVTNQGSLLGKLLWHCNDAVDQLVRAAEAPAATVA
jgi:predicted regulator of Ras-like GTPase activity (Roadblock/LC7/MglB family)